MPTILGKEVGQIGYGLMGLTLRPDPISQEEAFAALKAALKNGMNLWNGGDFYGTLDYNSLVLLERYFEKYPEDADKVVLSIKGAVGPAGHHPDGSPEGIRASVDNCMALLKGRKRIDIFECARRDQNTPLDVTFGVLDKEYVQTGKIGGIGLSEVKASTIIEASKLTKVVAVEAELSLFSMDVLHNGVAAACAELQIPLIAYSPLCRGLLSGRFKSLDDIPEKSLLRLFPRFQPETFPFNVQLANQVGALAKKKGCTLAQLSISWTIAQSRRPGLPTTVPIPGATSVSRIQENSKQVEITDAEVAELEATLDKLKAIGARYPDFVPIEG
ncbi:aldo/keto reductase [Paraphaeosphaeria sporulosa]|uniref:Aldo/keto reductase n=1 Tax=Paraphaeosphaeria sporulosa TaxID=1460663 RepID=A0A177BVB5_9PLEO|nr:aldo/keto reductase [Paraphaeosphaeria sporulosa]OAF98598.1 aldo/keto reductase [Paraphaeosphaeria sporulosa]